jgi:hypothetical protein
MKFKHVYSVAAILSCAGVLLSTTVVCAADDGRNQAAVTRQKQAEKNNPYDPIKTVPASLPYMPIVTPPGGKFLLGMKDSNQKGKIVMILRFGIQNPPADILKYYAEGLRNAKWTVPRADGRTVMAMYKGYSVSLSAYPGSHRGYPHDVVMNYQMPPGNE